MYSLALKSKLIHSEHMHVKCKNKIKKNNKNFEIQLYNNSIDRFLKQKHDKTVIS
jgi:hypothetical protein